MLTNWSESKNFEKLYVTRVLSTCYMPAGSLVNTSEWCAPRSKELVNNEVVTNATEEKQVGKSQGGGNENMSLQRK